MANELNVTFNGVGAPIYAIIRDPDGLVWNGTALVTFVAANLGTYAIYLTDKGGDFYAANAPATLPAARYLVQYYHRDGSSPSTSDTLLLTKAYSHLLANTEASVNLTTLAKVKQYANITDTSQDNLINSLIPVASEMVREYCGRDFEVGEYVERYDGNAIGLNRGWLLLRHVPVIEITKVTFDPDAEHYEELDGDEFVFDPQTGLVHFDPDSNIRRPWKHGFRNIEVEYEAGDATIPAVVEMATAALTANLLRSAGTTPTFKRERLGDYEYELAPGAQYDIRTLLGPMAAVLDQYKRVGFSA